MLASSAKGVLETMGRGFSIVGLILLLSSVCVAELPAQLNETALRGLEAATAVVVVDWDERISVTTEPSFERKMQDRFELGLLRAGLDIAEPNTGHIVACSINLMVSGGLVAYSLDVSLHSQVLNRDMELIWATTWSMNWVGTVGENNLDAASQAQDCSEAFELAWLRAQQG